MRALVVFESMFGNTRQIAHAIAAGLRDHVDVNLLEVSDAALTDEGVDLLVVGGPTHAFGMSRPNTRQEAQRGGATVGADCTAVGIREWLDALPAAKPHQLAAVFDTRVTRVRRLPGQASRAAGRQMRKRGYPLVAHPESFYVVGSDGPLAAGELERARRWSDHIGSLAASRSTLK